MATEITNSLDWANVEVELKTLLRTIKNPVIVKDARKMLQNINFAVSKLSQCELWARRNPGNSGIKVNEELVNVNEQISQFEQWIMIGVLSQ